MKLFTFQVTLGCALFPFAPFASVQSEGLRLHTATTPKALTYDLRTHTLVRTAPSAFFGPDVIYNNTCPSGLFVAMNPGDAVVDSGIVPAPDDAVLLAQGGQGCDTSYRVDGFEIGYCSDRPSNSARITFYELHDPCTSTSGMIATATFVLTGLPGSSGGDSACYAITVDLAGTTMEFSMAASGDGTATTPPDTFGVSYEFLNLTSTGVGPMLAGDPVFDGTGCDFLVGTVFEISDPTGSAPYGTGYGSSDEFALVLHGVWAGCFFFGGGPGGDPWTSTHLRLFSPDAGCASPVTPTCAGDGSYPSTSALACPCGNTSTPGSGEGCVNSTVSGGSLEGVPGSGASIALDDLALRAGHPPGNSGLLLVNHSIMPVGVAVFDGLGCVGGGPRILPGVDNGLAGDLVPANGFRELPGILSATAAIGGPGFVVPGSTYFAQYWYRDVLCGPPPSPCATPCTTPPPSAANFTNAVSWVTTP